MCADLFTAYTNTKKKRQTQSTGHTQKNGAVLIVNTITTAPFFCVCPVLGICSLRINVCIRCENRDLNLKPQKKETAETEKVKLVVMHVLMSMYLAT